jgi:anti-sigma regulatory factor (Ser/Thr protein kinase)
VSYCFYEILDNVLIHSGKDLGTVITHYDAANHVLSFLVADDGIGVRESLSENDKYAEIGESEVKMYVVLLICSIVYEQHVGFYQNCS